MKKNSVVKSMHKLEAIIDELIATDISDLSKTDKESVEILINEAIISLEEAIETMEQ